MVLEHTGEVNNSILYAGYQYDEETGMYYINARMYNPVIARFMQEDTYAGDRLDPLSLNLYSYCHNNPIRYWDPSGHFIKELVTNHLMYEGYKGRSVMKSWGAGLKNLGEGIKSELAPIGYCISYVNGASRNLDYNVINFFSKKEINCDLFLSNDEWLNYKVSLGNDVEAWHEKTYFLKPLNNFVIGSMKTDELLENHADMTTLSTHARNMLITCGEDCKSVRDDIIFQIPRALATSFNPKNLYKYWIDPTTSDEEMENLVTNGMQSAMMLASIAAGFKMFKGAKISLSKNTYTIPALQIVRQGNVASLVIGESAISIPTALEITGLGTLTAADKLMMIAGASVAGGMPESRSGSTKGAPKTKRFALGIDKGLDDFAAKNGAETYKNYDPDMWKNTVLDKLADPNTEVLVNLDGVDSPWAAVQRVARGGGGATDWELFQIKTNPEWWDSIKWFENGVEVPNPFK